MLKLWPTNIEVIDNFIEDESLYTSLKNESVIESTVKGQDLSHLSSAQKELYNAVNSAIVNYCYESDIDFNSLKLSNLQKGYLYKYDESMVCNHLYEPHHDIAEASYITALYYIDSDWSESKWVGGELAIYKHMSFVDYPENTVNILPKQNRLIIFPGFNTHRVKPYFGNKPRTSLVFGWKIVEPSNKKEIIL